MAPGEIERKDPVAGQAVFPGGIREPRIAGPRVADEILVGAVHADPSDARRLRERPRYVEAHAQDATVAKPEPGLGVEPERGDVGTAALAVRRPVSQLLVPPGGQRFLQLDRNGGQRT